MSESCKPEPLSRAEAERAIQYLRYREPFSENRVKLDALYYTLRAAWTEIARLREIETAAQDWAETQKAFAHRYGATDSEREAAGLAERKLKRVLAKPPTEGQT